LPTAAIWDLTYACPLRCVHCYSESGRRSPRQLPTDALLRVADALIAAKIKHVAFGGGEPLLVPGLFAVAERLTAAGVRPSVYTGGYTLAAPAADALHRLFSRVVVSLDGASAAVHDRIRGVPGSFERALGALALLDERRRAARGGGGRAAALGIDCVLLRSNFKDAEALCAEIAPRFPSLRYISFSATVPSGLASRAEFADEELLGEDALSALRDPAWRARLAALAPRGCVVRANDNSALRFSAADRAAGVAAMDLVQIEPNGGVRAILTCEGTVGNLLEEPLAAIWPRALARLEDAEVVALLASAGTMREWAAAVRQIDRRFAAPEDLVRISCRPGYASRPR
jgi:sulfatase maturation enzyme AslB (radical SAM superfamily)